MVAVVAVMVVVVVVVVVAVMVVVVVVILKPSEQKTLPLVVCGIFSLSNELFEYYFVYEGKLK